MVISVRGGLLDHRLVPRSFSGLLGGCERAPPGKAGQSVRSNDPPSFTPVPAPMTLTTLNNPQVHMAGLAPLRLISCSQSRPDGGLAAGDGRQGSIKPADRRLCRRNDMRRLIGIVG